VTFSSVDGHSKIHADRPRRLTRRIIAIVDAGSVLAATALAGRFVFRAIASAPDARIVPIALGVPVGFFVADALSGIVHWFCDTHFEPDTTVIGPLLIAPFREHHRDPAALGRHGFFERNGNNCLAALPFLAFGAVGKWQLSEVGQAFGIGVLAAAAATVCLTNQIHAWAHASAAPPVVRWLQRARVLLAPERHAQHHDGFHTSAYAVVSGWSNWWLDRVLAPAAAAAERAQLQHER
jgi:ubiquitin-conjugating enzyme E2 variant